MFQRMFNKTVYQLIGISLDNETKEAIWAKMGQTSNTYTFLVENVIVNALF
jgi:hypothetical protein